MLVGSSPWIGSFWNKVSEHFWVPFPNPKTTTGLWERSLQSLIRSSKTGLRRSEKFGQELSNRCAFVPNLQNDYVIGDKFWSLHGKKTAMFVTCSSATPCSQASTLLLVRVRPAPTWTCDSCSTSQQRLDSPFTSLRSLMTVIVFEPEICISPKKGPSLQLICGLFISWFCGQWKSIGVLHAITSWNAKHSIQMHPGNASGHFVTLPRRQMKAFGKPGVSTWNVGNPRDQIQAGLNGK